MIAAAAAVLAVSAAAGALIGRRSHHAVDGAFIGLLAGPLGVLALWFCRDGNWS